MAIAIDTSTTPRVSQLATRIQRALTDVEHGWVEGEVQRLKPTAGGHVYFTLADEDAVIDCCVWRSAAGRIRDWPEEGTLVQAHYRKVDFYARKGRLSIHVDAIRLTGEGELLARKQATLDKLTGEGLVARARRALPRFPRRVGVIAARNSDAMTDVIKALRERWPNVQIVARPALVEGVRAVDSVIEAIGHVQDIDGVDVIVLARGGGGVRDLVAFDDERLCRAVFACAVPVVTSIGHTAQRPNCDHLAGAYADVPARAAELVVPSAAEQIAELDRRRVVLENVPELLRSRAEDVVDLWSRVRPTERARRRGLELDGLDGRLDQVAATFYSSRERTLDQVVHRLAQARATVPGPDTLDLPGQQLNTAAARFFTDRTRELELEVGKLAAARMKVPSTEDIAAIATRIGPAFARARRRCQDYERAFIRTREEADRTFSRRLREREREIADVAAGLSSAARQRISEASQALTHATQLIEAKDFRRVGWILAEDAAGRPARSITGLWVGAGLKLHFRDGVADAAVTNIDHQPGAEDG